MWFHSVLFVISLSYSRSMELPSFIKACSRNDPNLNECATKSARDSLRQFAMGDPSRQLEPLDPLFVADMTIYVPNENGLKVRFIDNYFKGFSDLHLETLKFDLDKKIIMTDALVTLDVANKYDLSGKILMMPVKSAGDSSIKLKNTMLHIKIWYEHVQGDDGMVHWKITKHTIKYEVEKAVFKLDNLLNDKNISDQINKLLNDLWKEIVDEVGPSICQSLGDAVIKNLGVLLAQVPYDLLMPA